MREGEKQDLSRVLSVSGAGRKVGKTSFVCAVIERMATNGPLAAIKLSPHFHDPGDMNPVGDPATHYRIFRESSPERSKDSGRMLRAGASEVYLVQSEERDIMEAFGRCLELIPDDIPVVCENGSLLRYIRPGLSFFLEGNGAGMPGSATLTKPGSGARKELSVKVRGMDFEPYLAGIDWINGKWILNDSL